MINVVILLVLNGLFCAGVYSALNFEYDEKGLPDECTKGIFWWFKFSILDTMNCRVSKPLGNCLTCMASVFSIIPYWFSVYFEVIKFDFFTFDELLFYPAYIFTLAGFNRLIDTFING